MCVLTAMLILGVADNLIRLIAEDIGLHQFHFIRSLFALTILLAYARWRAEPLSWSNRTAVIWRGVLVGAAMYLYFASLAFLPIGSVVAGLFTAPVFVLLINVLMYGHRLQTAHVAAVGFGFIGMVCITLSDQGQVSLVHAVPVLAGLCYAASNVLARECCQGESTVVLSMAVFAILGVLGAIAMLILAHTSVAELRDTTEFLTVSWQPLTPRAIALTAFHALCASCAIGLLTFAYQHGLSTRVAVLEYVLLVFASLFAWLLWNELPTQRALLGMAMIALSGIVITRRA